MYTQYAANWSYKYNIQKYNDPFGKTPKTTIVYDCLDDHYLCIYSNHHLLMKIKVHTKPCYIYISMNNDKDWFELRNFEIIDHDPSKDGHLQAINSMFD